MIASSAAQFICHHFTGATRPYGQLSAGLTLTSNSGSKSLSCHYRRREQLGDASPLALDIKTGGA